MFCITFSTLLADAKTQLRAQDLPASDAEYLLAHAAQKNRAYLYAQGDEFVPDNTLQCFNHYVAERLQGIPLAYIIGQKDFWNVTLSVGPGVLIPRPETEQLVELVLAQCDHTHPLTILDSGTGSGAIAIALAREYPIWQVFACEKNAQALHYANQNIQKFAPKVGLIQSDWLSAITPNTLDVIVANPPYVDLTDSAIEKNVRTYEPASALFSDNRGLHAFETITLQAVSTLKPNGQLFFEHGYQQAPPIRNILTQAGLTHIHTHRDLSGHDRITTATLLSP